MTNSLIEWLQAWYLRQCNGDWEHEYGIKIGTIDNPGWSLIVDLADTGVDATDRARRQRLRSEHDWIAFGVMNGRFEGWCGPKNLEELIAEVRQLVEGAAQPAANS